MSVLTRRLLIVEDERLVATLLGEVFTRAGFSVDVAHSAVEAVESIDRFDPDGALIDVHLGSGPNGLQLGHRLSAARPELRLVFLSRFGLPQTDPRTGDPLPPNSSFVSKDLVHDPAELVALVEAALRDSSFHEMRRRDDAPLMSALTSVQLEVLRLAASGLTNQLIASRLGTVVRNVEQRLNRVYETLGIEVGGDVNPRVEAVRQYIAAFGLPSARGGDVSDA